MIQKPNNPFKGKAKDSIKKSRLREIRRIHLSKLAEKLTIDDIKPKTKKSNEELFTEYECWRCGKVCKTEICSLCKEELKRIPRKPPKDNITKGLKPVSNITEILTVILNFIKNNSFHSTFTKEDLLFANNVLYNQEFNRFLKKLISMNIIINVEKNTTYQPNSYRLTEHGIETILKIC